MQDHPPAPDALAVTDRVADAPADNWVDLYAPAWTRPYLRLSRADRPIGTWLLVFPCWWALALAILQGNDARWEDLWIFIGCGIGAFLMRGAGCTWNDITDRDFDGQVARTRSRPLPSGQATVRGALIWMVAQAFLAAFILFTFNLNAILLGILSLALVAIYPFAKRFTWWPQVFLGLAFNWGALLIWTAHAGTLGLPAVFLYLSGIAWTLFYDTIYAHQDTEDDALIGVKSTARLFGDSSPRWLRLFAVLTVGFMLAAVILATAQASAVAMTIAVLGPLAMALHLASQLRGFDMSDPARMLKTFQSNRNTGAIPLVFFAIALLA
jgi:4-hydroxybenzoate polyprenyltransferase